jgi:hypothetical protein
MPFPPSPYSSAFLVSIQRTVTHERLLRYLGATGQNVPNALILYKYNVACPKSCTGFCTGSKSPYVTPCTMP